MRQSVSSAEVQACRKPTERDNEIIIKNSTDGVPGLFFGAESDDRSCFIILVQRIDQV